MAHVLLRRQAIILRKLGKSYNQIRDELKVSKSTMSYWLRDYPLTGKQKEALKGNIAFRIEKYRLTMQHKREIKQLKYYEEAKRKLSYFSKRELFIAGLFLYWGEGSKTTKGQLVIANTDPNLIKFALLWITKALEIPKEKINVLVHVYRDMNITDSLDYWSKFLSIPISQFSKPYIKKSNRSDIDYKGRYDYGTCNLRVFNTEIKEKIMMALKWIANYSNDYSLKF